MACLWSHWSQKDEPELDLFAAITDEPPPEIAETGHQRCINPPVRFVPVAQAADDEGDIVTKAAKTIYRDVPPLAPGVSAQVKGQSRRAMDAVRELALDAADPTGTNLQAGAGRNPTATLSALKDAFDQEYASTVKNYVFPVPSDFRDQVATRIKAAMPKVDDETLNSVSAHAQAGGHKIR